MLVISKISRLNLGSDNIQSQKTDTSTKKITVKDFLSVKTAADALKTC